MNLTDFRQQYPQYDDMSDDQLANSLHQKYYADMPFENFSQQIGYVPSVLNAGVELAGSMQPAHSQSVLVPDKAPVLEPLSKPADAMLETFRNENQARQYADIGRGETALSQFSRGTGNVLANIPKTAGILSAQQAPGMLELLDQVDAGENALSPADNWNQIADLTQYKMQPEKRAGIRAKYENLSVGPENTPGYKIGKAIESFFNDNTRINPQYENEFITSKVPQGVGSTLGFATTAALTRGRGTPVQLGATAATGAMVEAASSFEDAVNNGASLEDAYQAAKYGGMIGTTEALPIMSILNRIDKGAGGTIKRGIVDVIKSGTEEGLQEGIQGILNNLNASTFVKYDPERDMWVGTGEGTGVGFTTGALLQLIGSMAGLRMRPNKGKQLAAALQDAVDNKQITGKDLQTLANNPVTDLGQTMADTAGINASMTQKPVQGDYVPTSMKPVDARQNVNYLNTETGEITNAAEADTKSTQPEITAEEAWQAYNGLNERDRKLADLVQSFDGVLDDASLEAIIERTATETEGLSDEHFETRLSQNIQQAIDPTADRARQTPVQDRPAGTPRQTTAIQTDAVAGPLSPQEDIAQAMAAVATQNNQPAKNRDEGRPEEDDSFFIKELRKKGQGSAFEQGLKDTNHRAPAWNNLPEHVRQDWANEAGLSSVQARNVSKINWGSIKKGKVKTSLEAVLDAKHEHHQRLRNEGKEREAINTAFDKLFKTIKSRQTKKGVALYSRNPVDPDYNDEHDRQDSDIPTDAGSVGQDTGGRVGRSGSRRAGDSANGRGSADLASAATDDASTVSPDADGFEVEEIDGAAFVAGLSPAELDNPTMVDYARQQWRDLRWESPFFKKWFGKGRFVRGGRPVTMYHGTPDIFDTFDKTHIGKRGHTSSGLGFFLTTNKEQAEHYQDGGQVMKLVTNISNPYYMELDEFGSFDTVEAAKARVTELQTKGHDGIFVRTPKVKGEKPQTYVIAFEPNQIKSLSNRGTFSPRQDNINFSKKPGQNAGLSVSDVEESIGEAVLSWSNGAPKVKVVASLDEVPEHILDADIHDSDGGTINGIYDQDASTIYLVAANIRSREQANKVLAHEAVGHYGIEDILGDELSDVLDRVQWLRRTNDGTVKAIAWEVFDRYGKLDEAAQSKEIIAAMAEKGIKHPVLSRIVAALKSFLRKLGFSMKFSTTELEAMIARAAHSLKSGKKTGNGKPVSHSGNEMFSKDVTGKAEETLNAIDEAAQAAPSFKEWHSKAKSKMLDDTRPVWLGTLTRLHLADVGKDVLPQIEHYVKFAQKMDADRNHLVGEAADVAQTWTKFMNRNSESADQLASLMHEATVAGVDPSEEYKPAIDIAEGRKKVGILRNQAKGRSGEGTAKFQKKIDETIAKMQFESGRKPKYTALRRKYEGLPDEAKAIYQQVRDMYTSRFEATLAALQARIDRAELSANEKSKLKNQIRLQFESMQSEGPYFPLARFGDYWISAQKGEGKNQITEFYMFSGSHQQTVEARKLRAQGYEVTTGKRLENVKAIHGASEGFVAEVIDILNQTGGTQAETVKDAVYQLYLSTLPDQSVRKHFIHRKKTRGYSQDALRAFASQSFHGSYQLAKLRYADILEAGMENMRESINKAPDPNKAADIFNELQKRHEWAMNPTSAQWANTATSVGFIWYLGITPSAALVNTTQTALVALPVLGSQYGFTKAAAELTRAGKDYFAGGFNIENALNGDEKKAYQQLVDEGVIDKTLAHDLAGMSETPSAIYSTNKAKALNVVSFLFHHAERFNREVTAMAAYRIARDNGMGHDAAVDEARKLTYESHFDYSNANKARFMQNDFAKVLLIFRQYSLNMTYLLARNAQQSLKGESKAVRHLAQKKLAGILGMHAMAAGVTGLPLWWMVEAVMNAVFDDEDDPWDFKTEFRNFLADYFGETAAAAIARGPVEGLAGLGLHSRVSLNELWFRSPDRDLEGKGYIGYWLEQIAGPLGGIAVNAGRAYDLINEGHTYRGIEATMPKAIRDGMKALRYAEGVTSLRGDQVVGDLSAWELGMQSVGFTPGQVAKQYDANRALKNYESRIHNRRQLLINRWYLAWRVRDHDGQREALDDIRRFNQKNGRNMIDFITLQRSWQTRQRYSRESRNGIHMNKRDLHLRDRVRFADE